MGFDSSGVPNYGVYLNWDQISDITTVQYQILCSPYFQSNYTLIDTVDWPQNNYIHKSGDPGNYYKIVELNVADPNSPIILDTQEPMIGEEVLVLDSLMYRLSDMLNIAIHDEEAIFNRDRTQATFAYTAWNYHPRPEIRISSSTNSGVNDSFQILSESDATTTTQGTTPNYPNGLLYKADYRGKIYFIDSDGDSVAIQPYDMVYASYSVRLFTGAAINNAAYLALMRINIVPGTTKYSSLQTMPLAYDSLVTEGATYFLLEGLMLRISNRETRLLIQDMEQNSFNTIDSLKDTMKTAKEFFENGLKEVGKMRYPGISSIVTPEYMMPGGRSRFFRYLWKGGA